MKRLMLFVVGATAVLLVAVIMSPQAVATSFFDSFDYGDGTAIHGQTPAGGEWFITGPDGNGVNGPKVFNAAGRGQVLLIEQASDPSNTGHGAWPAGAPAGDPGVARLNLNSAVTEDITLSFDYNTNFDTSRTLTLIGGSNPNAIGAELKDGLQIIFGKTAAGPEGQEIRYRQAGGTNASAAYDWPTNTWMEVEVAIQLSAKTYQMTIDDNTVFSDGSWEGYSDLSELQVIAFERHGGIRTAYMDNLSVQATIPEPASVALVLLAVSLLSGRGWSRRD